MMDGPQGARGAKSSRALCRNVEAQRRRKTPDCPVVLGLVACVTPLPLLMCASSLEPGSRALAGGPWQRVKSACQLRQESSLGTHPSQQAGEDSPSPPTPAASRTETLGSFLSLSGFWDTTTPRLARVDQVCDLGHPGSEVWAGGSYLPVACETPGD